MIRGLFYSGITDIFMFNEIKTKFLFGGILFSSAIMSFGSNAVFSRIELSQYFWLIMGIFYKIKKIREIENAA